MLDCDWSSDVCSSDLQRDEEKPFLDGARDAWRRKDWTEAHDRLSDTLRRIPDHPDAIQLEKQIRDEVSRRFAKTKPETEQWNYLKGSLAYLDGDWLKAVDSWERAYAFNPDWVALLVKMEKAKSNLAIQQKEEKKRLYRDLAKAAVREERPEDAVTSWQEVLALDSADVEARKGLEDARLALDADRRARRAEESSALSGRAMDAYLKSDFASARSLWTQVLRLDPGHSVALEYLARMSGGDGVRGVEPSANVHIPEGASQLQRGEILLREGEILEGVEALRRAVERNPNDVVAREKLESAQGLQRRTVERFYRDGILAYTEGRPADAIQQWREALKVDPDFHLARQAMVKLLTEKSKK
jgi:tetratricopeptide (TPR) repeat protein